MLQTLLWLFIDEVLVMTGLEASDTSLKSSQMINIFQPNDFDYRDVDLVMVTSYHKSGRKSFGFNNGV